MMHWSEIGQLFLEMTFVIQIFTKIESLRFFFHIYANEFDY